MLQDSVFLKDEAETEKFGRLLALATSDLPSQTTTPVSLTLSSSRRANHSGVPRRRSGAATSV